MGKEIAKVAPAALARPSFIPAGDVRGTEQIGSNDIQLPRLALAQALSPQLDEHDPKHVPGLRFGDAYNSLTGEIYSTGASPSGPGKPVEVVVLRYVGARFIEFNSTEPNSGIKDFNVPAGDPRTEYTTDPKTGERIKPLATEFREFFALLAESGEPIAISLKGSGLKVARTLNSLIKLSSNKLGNVPAFSFRFALVPTIVVDGSKKYAVYSVKALGTVDEATYRAASEMYDSLAEKTVVVDVERPESHEDKEDVPF